MPRTATKRESERITHPAVALDKHSPVPLYHQLYQALESMITQETYGPEEYFPTEDELCQMFGVSRITVRQTIAEMIEDGLLYRSRPRGRLQVRRPRVHQELTRLRGFFTEDMLTAGLQPHTVVRSVERGLDVRAATHLGIAEQERVFRIERVHEGNGEPLALQTSFIPVRTCPDLDSRDLSQSLFRMVEEAYHEPIVHAVQQMRVCEATRHETQLLHIRPQAYVIHVDRTSYAADGCAVEYFTCVLRSDRYDFTMELDLDPRAPDRAPVSLRSRCPPPGGGGEA